MFNCNYKLKFKVETKRMTGPAEWITQFLITDFKTAFVAIMFSFLRYRGRAATLSDGDRWPDKGGVGISVLENEGAGSPLDEGYCWQAGHQSWSSSPWNAAFCSSRRTGWSHMGWKSKYCIPYHLTFCTCWEPHTCIAYAYTSLNGVKVH